MIKHALANTHFPEIWEMLQYVDDIVIIMSKADMHYSIFLLSGLMGLCHS